MKRLTVGVGYVWIDNEVFRMTNMMPPAGTAANGAEIATGSVH